MSNPELAAWLASPQGSYVLDWEVAQIDKAVSDIFGFNALQIGLPQCDLLRANRMAQRLKIGAGDPVAVRCSPAVAGARPSNSSEASMRTCRDSAAGSMPPPGRSLAALAMPPTNRQDDSNSMRIGFTAAPDNR
ncbi:MAG TPA: hypothetical protein PLN02_13610, partial [Azonexus sp.]|nr:hypothetical protein [Azonexus sp.]